MEEGTQTAEIVGDRFAVGARVAAGAMGEVFLAEDRRTGARVALKRMSRTRDAARFDDECEALRALDHPSIVAYVAHGTEADGRPFLAMEWLEGEDLRSRLGRAEVSLGEAVAWLAGIAAGLGAAHARGIVHRDVKPENVVLVPDAGAPSGQRVKVVDFGLARAGAGRRAATRTGVIVGTPAYMAPEQVRASREVDARADVFALGAIAFECLAGRPAFMAESLLATFAKILFEDPPPLARARPGVPAALSDLVGRMLAKERAARPRDAGAVAAELLALGDLGGEIRPAPRACPAAVVATWGGETPSEEMALTAASGSAQALGIDENHCVGNAWNVCVLIWGKVTTRDGVADAERVIEALAAERPQGIGLITVVEDKADLPAPEVRAAITAMLHSLGGKVLRSAVVYEGSGFHAAAVRGVVTGLTMLRRLPYPHRVIAAVEAAVPWILEGLPEQPADAPQVLAAVRDLRRVFDEHRAAPRR